MSTSTGPLPADHDALEAALTDQLRTDILEGVFMPGARLVELQLTERYGAGRAAVRSALIVLESEGLVDRKANRGATVRRLTNEDALEITETRLLLEGLVAEHAARRASRAECAELQTIVTKMSVAVQHDDQRGYSRLNKHLHRRIREISGRETTGRLIETLGNQAARHRLRLSLLPGRSAASLEQHRAVVDAIDAGDPIRAGNAMRAHIASVAEVLRDWVELGLDD